MTEEKICSKCKEPKPIAQFESQESNADGKRSFCKECRKKGDKTYRRKKKKEKEWFEQFSPI